jgi:diacylglycerol kinase
MKQSKFSINKRLQSFKYAFNGIKILLKEEHNSRIHLIAAIIVIIAGFVFNINPYEWIVLVIVMGLVISMEIINSAIENICDFISPEKHHLIKKIKDLSAAAVMVCSITAFIVGLIVFIPKFFE